MNPFPMKFTAEFTELLTTAIVHLVWQGAVLIRLSAHFERFTA